MSPSAVINIPQAEDIDSCLKRLENDPANLGLISSAIHAVAKEDTTIQLVLLERLSSISNIGIKTLKATLRDTLRAAEDEFSSQQAIADHYVAEHLDGHVGASGMILSFDEDTGLWVGGETDDHRHQSEIGRIYASSKVCRRIGEARAISDHCYKSIEDKGWGATPARGVALGDGWYTVEDGKIRSEPLAKEHQAMFKIDAVPSFDPPLKMLAMLEGAFEGSTDPSGLIRQVQQALGLTMLNMLCKEQKAVFLVGAAGSGKSTLLKILVKMFPSDRVCSISPLSWDKEYNVAGMAGMALNSVPEIDRDVAIPAATFKSVVGEDLLGARQPYGRVFSFVPTAAQWFCGNSFMTTKDQTDGFWRRWSVIPFIKTVPQENRIEDLAEQIVETELPQIVGWALEGVVDRQKNGLFTSSDSSEALNHWRDDSDVVRSWLLADSTPHRSSVVGKFDVITFAGQPAENKQQHNASEVLDRFRSWCISEGRKPVGRTMFYERMAALGMPYSRSNGSWITNIQIKKQEPSQSRSYWSGKR